MADLESAKVKALEGPMTLVEKLRDLHSYVAADGDGLDRQVLDVTDKAAARIEELEAALRQLVNEHDAAYGSCFKNEPDQCSFCAARAALKTENTASARQDIGKPPSSGGPYNDRGIPM